MKENTRRPDTNNVCFVAGGKDEKGILRYSLSLHSGADFREVANFLRTIEGVVKSFSNREEEKTNFRCLILDDKGAVGARLDCAELLQTMREERQFSDKSVKKVFFSDKSVKKVFFSDRSVKKVFFLTNQ